MPTIYTEHVCARCNSRFTRRGERPYLYCSQACFHESRIGHPQNRLPNPLRKTFSPPITSTCGWCRGTFTTKRSAGARYNYCSRSCQAFARAAERGTVKPLTPTEAAYIAALIDGEGHITLHDRRHNRPNSIRPSLYVGISGTHRPLHDWLSNTVGVGTAIAVKRNQEHAVKSTKPCYIWRLCSLHAVELLRQVEPFMIEKRQKALAAIESQIGAESGRADQSVAD